jgi:uncharacterized membrane protein YfcA
MRKVVRLVLQRQTSTNSHFAQPGIVTFVGYSTIALVNIAIMLKWIFTLALVYFVYRFFISPPAIDRARERPGRSPEASRPATGDGDFIDYEEID